MFGAGLTMAEDSSADRRKLRADRRGTHRRLSDSWSGEVRFAGWNEQLVQFLTRYLFIVLALVFFGSSDAVGQMGMSRWQIYAFFIAHSLINTVIMWHAWRHPRSIPRYRIALWLDILAVSVAVLNDPYDIPPSLIVYILVVLGNGMRYGMRFFAEALLGTLAGGAFAIIVRYMHRPDVLTPGTIFLSLFGAIIIVYAYILMGRVERARHRSEQVSRTDHLTGLLNRRGLSEAADGWLANMKWRERKPVVMFADLDNFKTVNDSRGHAEGDRVLVQVAATLQQSMRSSDLIARYGGDEFVLLLADVELVEAQVIAVRIQSAIDDWFLVNTLACGISIGFGEVPPGEWNLSRVLQSVDRLLYESKAQRGGSAIRRVELI